MKLKIKYRAIWMVLIALFTFYSCSEDYLDVSDPTVMSEGIFPASVEDLDPILNDIYGRLPQGFYGTYMRMWPLVSHANNNGYNGAGYTEAALNEFNPNLSPVSRTWTRIYLMIGKCNYFFETIEKLESEIELSQTQIKEVELMKGQAHFLRALGYFHLINLYGETPIRTEADKNNMGVPLWITSTELISEVPKPRATQGEVYNQIITDLQTAETLLGGTVMEDKARANEWAAKSLLGKAYIFTLQYDKAKTVLKDVIDNSGKSLVSYDILRNMFQGHNEFNSEHIFDVNATPDPMGGKDQLNTGYDWMKGISVSYVVDEATGEENTNGFGNMFVHDKTLLRYGWEDSNKDNQNSPDHIAMSKQIRENKSVDMRLYVSTYQPYVDSILYEGNWKRVAKARVESYNASSVIAWNDRKYTYVDGFWGDNSGFNGINMNVIRLADVYLLYAEACMHTNDNTTALEYVNKIHRRAYDQPVNQPSEFDYASLTDKTTAAGLNDPLANEPLKYERWAELIFEGKWWFDVRRFDLGPAEVQYFETVMGGPLVWNSYKYALPIPTIEINSNSEVIQTPGY